MRRREPKLPTLSEMKNQANEWSNKYGINRLLYSGTVIGEFIAVCIVCMFFMIPFIIYGLIAF